MRDFRDAKVMARTLRSALAARGLKVTVSQSLELIAELFGVDDWNTLVAAMRREPTPREDASLYRSRQPTPPRSRELELTLHRTLSHADQRNHEYATLEHLLLALIDDPDASAVMKACKVNLRSLRKDLVSYIDNELKTLVTESRDREPTPTAAFQRVVQRALVDAQGRGRPTLTGAEVLLAILPEKQSHAAWFLAELDMTHYDAVNFIFRGNVR
jgi:hypothetical protein